MATQADFNLYKFMHKHQDDCDTLLGGSATPALSLNELKSLSTDPTTTSKVLESIFTTLPLSLTTAYGSEALRTAVAATYSPTSKITPSNILAVNGTTGGNHIVYRSLLSPADHVIAQYPIYGPLIEEPTAIGCSISYLRLDPTDGWSLSIPLLESLIQPGRTKLIILNNPVNPTGTHIPAATQRAIITLAKTHNITVHVDEIFYPLFHSVPPTSFHDHPDLDYDNLITTSSLSKAYGLTGIRVGWITTRSHTLYATFVNYRMFSVTGLSMLDEHVAVEALSTRCRPGVLAKHLGLAKTNLALIEEFVGRYRERLEWVRPTAGAVAFVRVKDLGTGESVDDVGFVERLVAAKRLLLAPASLCFSFEEGVGGKGLSEFKGRVRLHFTADTEVVREGLKRLGEFLDEEGKEGMQIPVRTVGV